MVTQPSPTRPPTRPNRSESASLAAHPSTAPLPARSRRSTLSQSAPSLVSANYQSDADESGSSETNALTQLQQTYDSDDSVQDEGVAPASSDDNSDAGHHTDSPNTSTEDTDVDVLGEDHVYLQELATSAGLASQTLAQADPDRPIVPLRHIDNDPNATFFAHLLDPVLMSELRRREFSEFVPFQQRHTLRVDRQFIRPFFETKAQKFVDMFELYQYTVRAARRNDELLEAFETFLSELMDCFDHPNEVVGWNPFSALGDLVEAGAVVRTPRVVRSCSRLTLGMDWGEFSERSQNQVGMVLMLRLHRLHFWRMAEINEILGRWSDKFEIDSTCETCNTDRWEIFLITTVLSMIKEGTRYIDIETFSDTRSEGSDRRSETRMAVDSSQDDNDDEEDNHRRDDHQGLSSDSEDDVAGQLNQQRNDPQVIRIDDTQEPPRPDTTGLQLRQRLLRNYGPNAYILRIVNMDEVGSGEFERPTMRVCPTCGYRFDGHAPEPNTLFYLAIEHAISVARQQIAALPETIDLPDGGEDDEEED